jgi:hypothetical protein
VLSLIARAVLVAHIMVENFWDCRLTKGLPESDCLLTPAPCVVL